MSICKHSKQMIAAICVVLASVVSQAAAPLCSIALLKSAPSISQAGMDLSISQLAQLKISIDINQSQRKTAPASARLRASYPTKFQELYQLVQSRMTEAQLRELVSSKINELQNGSKLEELEKQYEEQIRRHQEGETFKVYTKINERPLPFKPSSTLEYLSKQDSLLNRDPLTQKLELYNLKTGDVTLVQESNQTSQVTPDKSQILAINTEGILTRYNLLTSEISETNLHVKTSHRSSLNRSGSKMAVGAQYGKGLYIVDTLTGATTKITIPHEDSAQAFSGMTFHGENELLMASDFNGVFYRLDITTGVVQDISSKYEIKDVQLSKDETQLIFWGSREVGFIKISDLYRFDSRALAYRDVDQVRHYDTGKFYNVSHQKSTIELLAWSGSGTPLHTVPIPKGCLSIAFDLQGGRLFLGTKDTLEIWELR